MSVLLTLRYKKEEKYKQKTCKRFLSRYIALRSLSYHTLRYNYNGIRTCKKKKKVATKTEINSLGTARYSLLADHGCDLRPVTAPPNSWSIAGCHRGRTAKSNDACQRIPPACYTL